MSDDKRVAGEESGLYLAAIGYLVADKTSEDSWAKVATWAVLCVQNNVDLPMMKQGLKTVEQQVKADYKLTTMPAAWRSAKTAALKAVVAGVELVDLVGNVNGKSAVEKATKEKLVVPRNDADELANCLAKGVSCAERVARAGPCASLNTLRILRDQLIVEMSKIC